MADEGKSMLQNQPRPTMPAVPVDGELKPHSESTPPGHVSRVFNMQDRNMVVGACIDYCKKEGHRKFKDHQKLDQIKKLLSFDETLEYTR